MQITDDEIITLLADLDDVPGVSGFEGKIGDKIAGHMKKYVDEFSSDALGNRFFIKKGKILFNSLLNLMKIGTLTSFPHILAAKIA